MIGATARPPERPKWRSLCAAAALGALSGTGQAPSGLWWLTLIAVGMLAHRISKTQGRAVITTAWAAGSGYFAASMFWIVEPFLVDPARHGWMAPFALVLMSVGMALFWAMAGGLAALTPPGPRRALGFAAGLAAGDLTRTYVLTGFPWALLGHVWVGTPVMQSAAWFGPIGLTVLTATAAALPAG